jgi:hypothetical protein
MVMTGKGGMPPDSSNMSDPSADDWLNLQYAKYNV